MVTTDEKSNCESEVTFRIWIAVPFDFVGPEKQSRTWGTRENNVN